MLAASPSMSFMTLWGASSSGVRLARFRFSTVEKLADAHRQVAAWVEVTSNYSIPDWQYRDAKKLEASGVLINLAPRGEVTVCEGLIKCEIDKATALETTDHPLAPESRRQPTPCRFAVISPTTRALPYRNSF